MKQRTRPKLRLLALNLALALLVSLALPVTAGAAAQRISLGYGNQNMSGTGWTYYASDRSLVLDNYQGGAITVTGDLNIYSYGDVDVAGQGRGHGISAGSGDVYVYVQNGTLDVTAQQDACGIYAGGSNSTVAIVPLNGTATIEAGPTGAGIYSNGIVLLMSPPKGWTSGDTVYYDGRGSDDVTYTGKVHVVGPSQGYRTNAAIHGIYVMLDADGSVINPSSAPAIRCAGLVIGDDAYADTNFGIDTGSTLNMTIKAGGNARAIMGVSANTPEEGMEIAQHVGTEWGYYISGNPRTTPTSLTLYPKTYTTTIDAAGGTVDGQTTKTVAQAYPAHVKLGDYAFARTGYELTGFNVGGETVAANYEFIPQADTAVTALWRYVGKNDVSGQITFPQVVTETTYTGAAMKLSDFVSAAAIASPFSEPFTYTLSKDGGAARTVTLDSTVTDAGTYTVTAKYEDADNLGTQARTFTIQKATPVLTVPQSTTTVIVGNQERVSVKATLPGSQTLLPVTYTNSNPAALTVESAEGEAVLTGKAAGSASVTAAYAGDANINPVSASFQVEIIDLPPQDIAFDNGADKSATYGGAPFTDAAVNNSTGGGAVTYASSDPAVATVDNSGRVTIEGAGKTTITATAAAVPGAFAATSVSYDLTVAKKAVTAQAAATTKTFDGTTDAQAAVTLGGLVNGDTLTQGTDYAVTARFEDPNAGTGKTVQVEVALKNTAKAANYTLTNPSLTLTDGVINKAPALTLPTLNLYIRYTDTSVHSQDVSRLLPDNAGSQSYSLGAQSDPNSLLGSGFTLDVDRVTFALREGLTREAENKSASVPVILTSDNYVDSTVDVVANVVYEFVPVVDVEDISTVYTGQPVADTAISGTAVFDGQTVEGTWSFKAGQDLTTVADSGPKTVVFTPADPGNYARVEAVVLVNIAKADPAGEPSYTAIGESGKTLADAQLGVGTITVPGTIAWDDGDATAVTANTAYDWTFIPDDTANYNVRTGTITPYVRSSGGGGGGSSTYAVSVESDDNGSVSVSSTRASRGDTVTVTVKPDRGYVLDRLIITDRDGDAISYKSRGDGKYTFTMPASAVTVEAVFVQEDEEPGFTDVPADAYYADAVAWAVENGITNGLTDTAFAPNSGCTRGQVVTFLWRAAGEPEPETAVNPFTDVSEDAYNYEAILWAYENGITSGTTATTFAPNATCTRAQIVTFLYRAGGAQTMAGGSGFTDVPADAYYADAVAWAVENGITNGITATTFAPNETCTRAQIVTFLYRDRA